MSSLMHQYVSNGEDLFKVVDTFRPVENKVPAVFLYNVKDETFAWYTYEAYAQMIKVDPE